MNKSGTILRKDVIGWSLYDFANTIYSMNILSLYFKRWLVEDLGRDGLYYDLAYAGSMFVVAIIMPALGALSDHSTKKKLFLFLFTASCCVAVGIIPAISSGYLIIIIILFGISNFFYEGGMVFYNALMYSISDGKSARMVSGLGVSLGYLGAILGMILVLPFVEGELFGMEIPFLTGGGKPAAFLPSALLFFICAMPLFLWVKEKKELAKAVKTDVKTAYKEVWEGIRNTKKYPGVIRFLIADYFFEDAVATVILNIGIFSSIVIGFSDADLTIFLIVSTVFATLGAFLIGKLTQFIKLKKMMNMIIWGWLVVLTLFIFIENHLAIYILGSAIGVLLGGLWTVSRPLLAEMVPKKELGRFFGLYSLSGKAAAMIGPVLWGVIVYVFSPDRPAGKMLTDLSGISAEDADKLPYRLAVFSLMVAMAIGLYIFRKVPETED